MLYIQYNTKNLYEAEIRQAIFDFQVTPINSAVHSIENIDIKSSFSKNHITYQNRHGFDMTRISVQETFKEFFLFMNAAVSVKNFENIMIDKLSVDEQRNELNSDLVKIDYHDFLEQTDLTNDLDVYILPESFSLGDDEGIFAYIQRINHEIGNLIKYNSGWTDTTTTAGQALKKEKGVCQDFSHIMIAILRAHSVPSRYVAGYLYTPEEGNENSQLHAWVEAYIQGNGWTGFDPANGLMANEHYIKISHGIDYSECTPIKGILAGPGANTTWHEVKISEDKISPSSQQQQ